LGKANVASGTPTVTILFISLSAAQYNLESDWAEAGTKGMVRHCPICVQDSIAKIDPHLPSADERVKAAARELERLGARRSRIRKDLPRI
jgi:hypothetical protein